MRLDSLLLLVGGLLELVTSRGKILQAEQQQGFRRQPVTACAARFLVITLQVTRQVVMHHEAYVWLVDAHAERHGRDDDGQIVTHESFLHIPARPGRQSGVIGRRRIAALRQECRDFLDPLARQCIDNARLVFPFLQKAQQLALWLVLFQHACSECSAGRSR